MLCRHNINEFKLLLGKWLLVRVIHEIKRAYRNRGILYAGKVKRKTSAWGRKKCDVRQRFPGTGCDMALR